MHESERKVILAEPRGFCAGVERAIAMVERALELHGEPVYVRKEIVHNRHVVDSLARRGAIFVDSEDDVPPGSVCLFSAHGVSPAVRANAVRRQLTVIDATCPLVSKVHQQARREVRAGRLLVLVGHNGHEETEGTRGESPDHTVVVESVEDVARLELPDDTPIAYVTQTTLSLDDTADIVTALTDRFSDVAAPPSSTICYASQNRQNGIKALARRSDLVLVVGATNSSNSLRMVDVARQAGVRAHLVPDVSGLDPAWLDGVATVGVSSGASVPEVLVQQLLERLDDAGFAEVETDKTAEEHVVFAMPSAIRQP
ncbi:4-hydroxy-3-methylbut-2-enyl diphosphate reductase [Paractinoplanes rhizophilus]|uniref:4-hydroxy-3-methylbut-2-enyl diphosphate reductase n=1 Tax=Paractinoplanes rhizophilus TaxID=1416877 RepID=A0ABW2HJS6_9ACTN